MLKDNILLSTFSIAKYNYKKLFNNPRFYILMVLQFIFLFYLINPFLQLSKSVGIKITPWLFPHITGSHSIQILMMLGVLILFADAPFIDDEYNYLIIRCGRRKWVLGQILYIITASFIYFFIIFLLTVILISPNIFISLEWGKLLNTMANTSDQIGQLLIYNNILLKFTPIQATGISIFLSSLGGIVLGLVMFVLNLKSEKSPGFIVAGAICFIDYTIVMNAMDNIKYISPISLTRLSNLTVHSFGINTPTVQYAIGFQIVLIVILAIISIAMVGKKSVQSKL